MHAYNLSHIVLSPLDILKSYLYLKYILVSKGGVGGGCIVLPVKQ